jgi:hypothetical protein
MYYIILHYMSNYKIEDNIDFYKELYNSLDYDSDTGTNTETNTKTNICQITGSELKDKYVTLECSHKFNYDALYTDICKQKFEFNSYTSDVLSINDLKRIKDSNIDYYIKCPYCRNIQLELLPYYEELPFTKKYGVNTNDTDYRVVRTSNLQSNSNNGSYTYKMYGYTFKKGVCCKMVTKNNKQIPCYNTYSTELMTYDGLSKEYSIKHYCPIHIRGESKQNKIEIQKKKFEEKMKAKEDKLKIKEEKLKIKEDKKTQSSSLIKSKLPKQNIVISTENAISVFNPSETLDSIETSQLCLGCNAIIKTGSRKGSMCGIKIYENNMCKRHKNNNSA